jgi:predicted phage tail protein
MGIEKEQLVSVFFYGTLRKRFGRRFKFAVRSPQEAGRALASQVPGFRQWVLDNLDAVKYRVLVDDVPRGEEDISDPLGSAKCIKIVPVICGAGSGDGSPADAGMKIVGGVVLIALGVVISVASFGGASAIGGMMISIGISMVISGVSQLFAKTPEAPLNPPTRPDGSSEGSGGAFGPTNTVGQGSCIPVGYGKMRVGGRVISASSAVEAYPTGANGGAFSGGNGSGGSTGDGDAAPLVYSIDPAA